MSSNISSTRQKWSWSHRRALPRKSWRHIGASQLLGSGFLGFDSPASVAGAWQGGKGQEWAVRDLVGRRTGGRAHTPRSSSALLDIWKKKNSVTKSNRGPHPHPSSSLYRNLGRQRLIFCISFCCVSGQMQCFCILSGIIDPSSF